MTNLMLIPLLVDSLRAVWIGTPAGPWGILAVAAGAGALLGNYAFDREVFPEQRFKDWVRQATALSLLMLGTWVALIGAAVLMPPAPGLRMALVVGGYLAFHFALQFGLVLRYLRWVGFSHPAGNRLRQIVQEVTSQAGTRVRATWEMDGSLAQAYAFTTTQELMFSRRLLEICSDEEVKAICAHEVAHLGESPAVLAGRLAGSLSLFPLIFFAPLFHWLGLIGFLLPFVVSVGLIRFSRWLSRRMETRADHLALGQQTSDGVYAQALEKIYRANHLPAVSLNKRQTHPDLYDRMVAAGVTPEYPRPGRPKRMTWVGWLYILAFALCFGLRIATEK